MSDVTKTSRQRPLLRTKPTGWSLERRARHALAIRSWQPWTRSTGPRTAEGKARTAMNAYKHGARCLQARIEIGDPHGAEALPGDKPRRRPLLEVPARACARANLPLCRIEAGSQIR